MKKTKYYFEVGGFYNENCDWGHICSAASKEGILLYKEKSTDEIYSYEDISKHTLKTGGYVWEFKLLRSEEVDIEPVVTKLKPGKSKKTQWKSSNKGGNGKNVTLNPKPSNVTKNPGPVRYYNKVEQDGFTRPNKPKNNPSKGTIVGIFTGV